MEDETGVYTFINYTDEFWVTACNQIRNSLREVIAAGKPVRLLTVTIPSNLNELPSYSVLFCILELLMEATVKCAQGRVTLIIGPPVTC
jgi:hypothetical protein